ncbi:alpha/beta hydrolase [Pseudoxanthomonas kalamensis DSM 18571]|uniref:alpha/beta fold hydrolase n=1 Tax=Pseudoxanthomonas kalamensis TaxID=289483 RepID=UPI001390A6CA|nr:alpha/beta hydrolase [Pseudoxanthomonas kalamensis]KAF1709773.1 alpha/beta hydrolase [Pseudoxanthomonas kalamensis DSM 18571]
MTSYRELRYPAASGGLTLYARDYGPADARLAVLCMHGFSRNSADFDRLAPRLAERYRVVCPDQRGRGRSDHDPEPARYTPATYVQDMAVLMARLGLSRAVMLGTSMGGVMAMVMGATAPQSVAGLILNDVGPEVDPAGLQRIRAHIGTQPSPRTWEEAVAQARQANAVVFPDYDDGDWQAFTRRLFLEDEQGRPVSAYDPAIANAFADADAAPAPDLWPLWDALRPLPALAIRGETSDILSVPTLARMVERHPGLLTVTVPGRGHAPMLDEPVAYEAIERFLLEREESA